LKSVGVGGLSAAAVVWKERSLNERKCGFASELTSVEGSGYSE
jgi:hypothetical protein